MVVFLIVSIFVSTLFTGIGIYSICRKKPMWFWSEMKIKETEITDVKSYNKANGVMWLIFSAVFWISVVLGFLNIDIASFVLAGGIILGIPALAFVYTRIYAKYKMT